MKTLPSHGGRKVMIFICIQHYKFHPGRVTFAHKESARMRGSFQRPIYPSLVIMNNGFISKFSYRGR